MMHYRRRKAERFDTYGEASYRLYSAAKEMKKDLQEGERFDWRIRRRSDGHFDLITRCGKAVEKHDDE